MYRISRDMAEKLTILKDRTMSSNRCCDYTDEALRTAAKCRFKRKRKDRSKYMVTCPNCGKSAPGPAVGSSYIPNGCTSDYFGIGDFTQDPGAALRVCRGCGQVYRDPRYREVAMTGHPQEPDKKGPLIAIGMILTLCFFMCIYYANSQKCLFDALKSDGMCRTTSTVTLCFFLGLVTYAVCLFAYIRLTAKKREKEVGLSAERLQNPEYLKAMDMVQIKLPKKYSRIIRPRNAILEATTPKDEVFLMKNGCCDYCGYVMKTSTSLPGIGASISECPQCHSSVYDKDVIELGGISKERRRTIYDRTRSRIMRSLTNCALTAAVSLAVLIFMLIVIKSNFDRMFYGPFAPGFEGRLFFNKFFFLELVACALSLMALYVSVKASAVRIKLLGKDYKSALDDSIRRMKSSAYAEKYASASNRNEIYDDMDATYYGYSSENLYKENEKPLNSDDNEKGEKE